MAPTDMTPAMISPYRFRTNTKMCIKQVFFSGMLQLQNILVKPSHKH